MGNVEKRGEVKKNGKKFLFSTVFVLAGLVAISTIYIFATGKYRLFIKPQPSMLPMSGKGQAITPAHKEAKAVRDDDIENILQKYNVEFYAGRKRFNGNPSLLESIKIASIEIPPSIRLIAGLEKEKGYYARYAAVNSLGKNLSDKEVNALLYFLHKRPDDDNLSLLEFDSVKNDAVLALIRQANCPDDLVPHLIVMYRDRTFDNVWRAYCIQFMGTIYGKIANEGYRSAVDKVFDEALHDVSGIPGTTLVMMTDFAGQPGFEKSKIADAARSLCADVRTDNGVRITALQVCARLGDRKVIPVAREIAGNSDNIPLKISAVAALGAFGEPADRELINSLASSGDIRMRTAAKAALKKIKM